MTRRTAALPGDMKLVGLMRSQRALDEARAALHQSGAKNVDLRLGELADATPATFGASPPDVLLVDLGDQDPPPVEALRRLAEKLPGTAVLATGAAAPMTTVRTLMRIGVADFVPQPIGHEDLRDALAHAASRVGSVLEAGRGKGRVITFMGSCGGAGATTLAVQTAVELRGSGGRKKSTTVCVADLDLQFGNVGLSLDIRGGNGLVKILETPDRLDAAFLGGAMERHGLGMDILCAPPSIVPLDALEGETATEVLRLARKSYDFTVLDLPHAWTNWTADVLRASDLIVLVTRLNVTAIERTRRHLSLVREQELDDVPLAIVANRLEKRWGQSGLRRRSEDALGQAIDRTIRADDATAAAARDRGIPLREVKRSSRIEKDVRIFVKWALSKMPAEATAPVEARTA